MKSKSYLTLVFLLLSTLCYSQSPQEVMYRYKSIYSPVPYSYFPVSSPKFNRYLLDNEIRKVFIQKSDIKKNGKVKPSKYARTYHFDEMNGTVSMVEGFKRGKKAFTLLYTRDTLGRPTSVVSMNKKGEINHTEIKISGDGRQSEYYKIDGEGDTLVASSTGGIESLSSTDYYFKKGKLKYQWYSEYYPDLQLKQTTQFKANGKVKNVWDYQCNPEGKEIAKHKDTVTICKSKTVEENGDTLFVEQRLDTKGNPTKYIRKKNKYGRWYYGKTTKGADDVVQSEWLYYYRQETELAGYKYKVFKKGQLLSESHTTYDKNGNETAKTFKGYKKGAVVNKQIVTYEYDDKNRPIKKISNDELTGTKSIATLKYE